MLKKNTVLVSGNFNILHPGHLRLLRFAKECGNRLIVAVESDRIAGINAHVHENLRLENRKLIEQMVNTLVQAQPELSQKPANKPLTAQPENVGGGGVNLHDPLSAYKRRQNQAADQPFCDAVKRDIEDSQKKDAVTKVDYGSTLT